MREGEDLDERYESVEEELPALPSPVRLIRVCVCVCVVVCVWRGGCQCSGFLST